MYDGRNVTIIVKSNQIIIDMPDEIKKLQANKLIQNPWLDNSDRL